MQSTTKTQARAPARALVAAAAFGALAGIGLGTSYLGGWLAEQSGVQAKAERLAVSADGGFSAHALAQAGVDENARLIAERHDPYAVAGGAERDRQAALFAARLERADRTKVATVKASSPGPAAEPFRLQTAALDASRDLDCLTTAVYFEARGEGVSGKRAVAQVVLNRARHPAFPNSVCGVVFQGAHRASGCQFSFACNGQMRQRRDPALWERSRQVAAAALAGYVDATVGNATHFHATRVNPGWSNTLVRVASVGNHVFYKFGGRAGRPGAFRYEPAPSKAEEFKPMVASVIPTDVLGLDQAGRAVKDLFGHREVAKTEEARPAPAPVEAAAKPATEPVSAEPVVEPTPAPTAQVVPAN